MAEAIGHAAALVAARTVDEVNDLDDDDFMDERFFEELKAKRIAEIKARISSEKFGEVRVSGYLCVTVPVALGIVGGAGGRRGGGALGGAGGMEE